MTHTVYGFDRFGLRERLDRGNGPNSTDDRGIDNASGSTVRRKPSRVRRSLASAAERTHARRPHERTSRDVRNERVGRPDTGPEATDQTSLPRYRRRDRFGRTPGDVRPTETPGGDAEPQAIESPYHQQYVTYEYAHPRDGTDNPGRWEVPIPAERRPIRAHRQRTRSAGSGRFPARIGRISR